MNKGTEVIRRADLKAGRPVFGVIDKLLPDGRVQALWNVSQSGGVRHTGRANHSSLKLSALVEATPEVKNQVRALAQRNRSAYWRRWLVERPYVCINVNPAARVANDGHRSPENLLPGQVQDGKCLYCGAAVVNRCVTCEQPVASGQTQCAQCQDVAALVARGVQLLNKCPGWLWEARVNLEKLDMAFHGLCLLSQVFDSYEEGIQALNIGPMLIEADLMGGSIDWERYGWEYGFTVPPLTPEKEIKGAFARLTNLWTQVITQKRQASLA